MTMIKNTTTRKSTSTIANKMITRRMIMMTKIERIMIISRFPTKKGMKEIEVIKWMKGIKWIKEIKGIKEVKEIRGIKGIKWRKEIKRIKEMGSVAKRKKNI